MLSAVLLMSHFSEQPLTELPREFRAAWVATVDNIDWPSVKGLSPERQRAEFVEIVRVAKESGLNALVLQVRPSADAFYASDLEPWSEFLNGEQGKAPEPFYDPLRFAVEEAHKAGLELHCWFNPYRAWHPAAKGKKHSSYIGSRNPELVKKYGKYEWMDPGEPAVRDRTLQVIVDVVRRYDIDGVHIDDYFYPYPINENGSPVDFPDGPSWRAYQATGGSLSKADWRRENVNRMIKGINEAIHAEKPWVKFGISPFGIYRSGYPAGIVAGLDQYAELYADAKLWLNEGWCDYFTPQLYWPTHQTKQAYEPLLNWWLSENKQGRHVWPGNFTSRTNPKEGNWPASEVAKQVEITRKSQAGGNVHFSMKAILKNWNSVRTKLASFYWEPALVPASPWLKTDKVSAPDTLVRNEKESTLTWEVVPGARFYVVQGLQDGKWRTLQVSSLPSYKITGKKPEKLAIRALDRVGKLSEPLILEP